MLDLDETLIHYNESKSLQQAHLLAHEFRMKYKRDPTVQELTDLMPEVVFNVRPYSEYFLNEMAQFFEIIVFTAAEQAVSCVYFTLISLVRGWSLRQTRCVRFGHTQAISTAYCAYVVQPRQAD